MNECIFELDRHLEEMDELSLIIWEGLSQAHSTVSM